MYILVSEVWLDWVVLWLIWRVGFRVFPNWLGRQWRIVDRRIREQQGGSMASPVQLGCGQSNHVMI